VYADGSRAQGGHLLYPKLAEYVLAQSAPLAFVLVVPRQPSGADQYQISSSVCGAALAVDAPKGFQKCSKCRDIEPVDTVPMQVAACVCLFALDKADAIPVDTHVWQLACRYYAPHLRAKTLTPAVGFTYPNLGFTTWSISVRLIEYPYQLVCRYDASHLRSNTLTPAAAALEECYYSDTSKTSVEYSLPAGVLPCSAAPACQNARPGGKRLSRQCQ